MSAQEYEEVFFDFVKNHDILTHLMYAEHPVKNQKIIGVVINDYDAEDRLSAGYVPYYASYIKPLLQDRTNAIIDPNWDNVYKNFINIDYNPEAVEYIKSFVEDATKEEQAEFIKEKILTKFIASNIDAENVYIVINSHWDTGWFDQIVEV